jgi:fumarylpyruvate hydrolase
VWTEKSSHILKLMTTQDLIFPAQTQVALPVQGSDQCFPVGRVFCIGRNYPWSPEDRKANSEFPSWFMKPNSAVFLAEGVLPFPPATEDFCHEVELVVGIGKGGFNIDREQVESQHVWGYAVGLDLTRRDLQKIAKTNGSPWEPTKAFDASAPCSPMVPAKLCGHPRDNAIWLNVNQQVRQRAVIADLLFDVPDLIATLSRSVTLLPGDLIFTGTPVGVGALQPSDHIQAGISGIGDINMQVGARTAAFL